MSVLKLIFLLSTWSFTVTATDLWMTHYLLKNSSVCLNVKKTPPYRNGLWTFDGKFVADKDSTHEDYAERVVFSSENLTLCINRLTENDTGTFKASYLSKLRHQSENHQVIVQGMVPRPVMTVTPGNHSSGLAESCNFTVNCSIQDDWLGSDCDQHGCRPSQKSFNKFNITILSVNTTVVCRSNNHVSRNDVSVNISITCLIKLNSEESQSSFSILMTSIRWAFVCICAAVAIKLFAVGYNRHKAKTATALLTQSSQMEMQSLPDARVSMCSSSETEHSYQNVEAS